MAFYDIPQGHPMYREIAMVTDLHIITGFTDGTFRGDNPMSAGEICLSLCKLFRLEALPEGSKCIISPQQHWAAGYYQLCVDHGLIQEIDVDLDQFCVCDFLISALSNWSAEHKQEWPIGDISNNTSVKMIPCIRAMFAHIVAAYLQEHFLAFTHNVLLLLAKSQFLTASEWLFTEQRFAEYFPDNIKEMAIRMYDAECKGIDPAKALYGMAELYAVFLQNFALPHEVASVYHYTSMAALEKLTQKNAHFRMSNVIYLNDPKEGRFFYNLVLKDDAEIKKIIDWPNDWEKTIDQYYIGSFSYQSRESLPMWNQYGNQYSGCRLEFEVAALDSVPYKVNYGEQKTAEFAGNILEKTDSLIKKMPEIKSVLSSYITYIFGMATFLCKDSAFEHEDEVRLVKSVRAKESLQEDFIRTGEFFPRRYTEMQRPIRLKGILLGPHVTDQTEAIVNLSLKARDCDCPVLKSKIAIR